jgi:hypothetical protein
MNEDPIRDGQNWYAYAGNNPVMFVDPSGLYYIERHDTKIPINYFDGDPYIDPVTGEALTANSGSSSGKYTLVLTNDVSAAIKVGIGMLPFFGNSLSNPVYTESGKFVGGTSLGSAYESLALDSAGIFSDMISDADISIVAQGGKLLGAGLNVQSAADVVRTFNIASEDKVLSQMIGFLGLPTTTTTFDELNTQMNTLSILLDMYPSYFYGDIGNGKSLFEQDMAFLGMSEDMREVSIFSLSANYQRKAGLPANKYRDMLWEYESRLEDFAFMYIYQYDAAMRGTGDR